MKRYTYELSQTAYIKIVLHALKHPSSAVNGILLGRVSPNYIMEIVDVMPVSHTASNFYPFFQIALYQLDHKKLDHLIKEKDGDPAVMLFISCGISGTPCLQAGPEAIDELVLKEPSAHALLADYIASKKLVEIVDFEDHLNDITKDWLNPNLFE